MINVVLDSSIYCEDFRMGSPRFKFFWSTLNAVGARLVVPAIVRLEVNEQYRMQLLQAAGAIANPTRHEGAFRGRWMSGNRTLSIAETANEKMSPLWSLSYASHFDDTVRRRGFALFLDFPRVSHSELAARCAAHRKPFGRRGRGYGDALIWYSLLEQLREDSLPAHLVTANTEDFAYEGSLHPDLAVDVEALGVHRDAVRLHTTIEDWSQFALKSICAVAMERTFDGVRVEHMLRTWIADNLLDVAAEQGIVDYVYPFDVNLVSMRSQRVSDIESMIVTGAYEFPEGAAFIIATTRVVLSYTFESTPERMQGDRHLAELAEGLSPDDDHLMGFETRAACTLWMVFAMGTRPPVIKKADICSIEGGWGAWDGQHPLESESWNAVRAGKIRRARVMQCHGDAAE